MKKTNRTLQFAVCIGNAGQEASLLIGKLYEVLPDADAGQHGYLRVIDEDGEDYLHAATNFYLVDVPKDLARTLHTAYQETALV